MKAVRKFLSDQEGVALVFVALMLVVIMGMSALVIDYGSLTTSKRHLVATADAAALAGVQELAEVPIKGEVTQSVYDTALAVAISNAKNKAAEYVALNYPGVTTDVNDMTVVYSTTEKSLTVPLVKEDISLTFAKFLGHNYGKVSAASKAAIEYVDDFETDGSGSLLPFFLTEDTYEVLDADEAFTIKGKDADTVTINGVTMPGNFGFAAFNPYMESDNFLLQNKYLWYLCAGEEILQSEETGDLGLSVDSWIKTTTGNITAATPYLKYRYDKYQPNAYAMVPIVTNTFYQKPDGTAMDKFEGTCYNKIIGYAMIRILDVDTDNEEVEACLDPKEWLTNFKGSTTNIETEWNRTAKVLVLTDI